MRRTLLPAALFAVLVAAAAAQAKAGPRDLAATCTPKTITVGGALETVSLTGVPGGVTVADNGIPEGTVLPDAAGAGSVTYPAGWSLGVHQVDVYAGKKKPSAACNYTVLP